ncbi:MAG: hypothetical protein EOO75_15105 [Myxococcales bacterium]|nr:MAG: hypothetical protein EOO75_15105 [Myxococcales bacterium]
MLVLLDLPHMRVLIDRSLGLVRYERTSLGFDDVDSIDRTHDAIMRVLETIDRSRLVLLVDLREGPARNDPAFEQAMARHRPRILGGYRRVASLVRTAVGKLQVGRHLRDDGLVFQVMHDEDEALRYLLAPGASGPPR